MTKRCLVRVAACSVMLLAAAPVTRVSSQIRYARGQTVGPAFDGWARNPDGTYTLYFGYFNRNSEELVDVPIGMENTIEPGGDRGQPTHFYPGRKWWVFSVVVPGDWPKDKRVVWTLVTHGTTNQAKGWLQPEYEVDQDIIAKNSTRDPFLMRAGGQTDFENRPPAITATAAHTVVLPNALTLTATATDDGRPRPEPTRQQVGVRVRWIVYRGAGSVQLDPDIMGQRVYGQPAALTTEVTFSTPGSYRLRAIASDGQSFSTRDVDVTVR